MSTTTRHVYRRSPKVAGDVTSGSTLVLTEEEPITLTDPHSILIRVHAVSLNYRDVNIIHGTNPWAVKADGIPCSDAAGVVVEIGSKVTDFKVGDKVSPIFDQQAMNGTEQSREWLGGEVDGVLATHVVFPADKCVKPPEHLSFEEAACLPNAGITAWSALMGTKGELQVGKTVLIQGTGGVSMMAVKMARAAGCKVILTSSSDEKLERVRRECDRESGPNVQVVNYTTNERWDEEVVRLNGGRSRYCDREWWEYYAPTNDGGDGEEGPDQSGWVSGRPVDGWAGWYPVDVNRQDHHSAVSQREHRFVVKES